MDLSLVIPAFNERESLPELLKRISDAVRPMGLTYEVIVIDDGSTDGTFDELRRLKEQHPQLIAVRFRRNYGKSPALSVGFRRAQGRYVITMDADLQDDPAEIPPLLQKRAEVYDLVSGWKKKRHDPLGKRLPSKLFNKITSRAAGVKLHDFNCGLKAYRRPVVKSLQVYGEFHRFLPLLAHWQGFRVTEMVVQHHARKYGISKFGVRRFFNGFFDLLTVMFLTRFKTSPLHVFGMMGLVCFLFGFAIEFYLSTLWFMGQGIAGRPLFFLGILLIIVGVQFVGFGLVAEMISSGIAENVEYSVRDTIE